MFIFEIDLTKLANGGKSEGVNQGKANPDSILLKTLGKALRVDDTQGTSEAGGIRSHPESLFGKITDLANEYIIYALNHKNDFNLDDNPDHLRPIMKAPPWEQSNELFDALSQYTGIQASDKKVSDLKNFFYSIMRGNVQDPNGDGTQDVKDVFAIWGGSNPGDDPLTTIQDLSKKLLEDPYNYLTQVPKLGKALAEYTNSEYDLGKADRLISFFLREKSDLTGDGVIDSQDVIKFWKDMDKPTKGDINEDGNIDKSDVRELRSDLWLGDMNYDGKLDQEDYKLLEERLNPVPVPLEGDNTEVGGDQMTRPFLKPKGDLNKDGKIDRQDLEQLGKVLKSGDMDDDGKVDQKDLELLMKEVHNRPIDEPVLRFKSDGSKEKLKELGIEITDPGVDPIAGAKMSLTINGKEYYGYYSAFPGIRLEAKDGSAVGDDVTKLVNDNEKLIRKVAKQFGHR